MNWKMTTETGNQKMTILDQELLRVLKIGLLSLSSKRKRSRELWCEDLTKSERIIII